jgi:hypothetical protein
MYTVLMAFAPLMVAVAFLLWAVLFAKDETGSDNGNQRNDSGD